MSLVDEYKKKGFDNLPAEFYQFIQMCDGLDIDFNNCTIGIEEYKKSIENRDLNASCNETIVDITMKEKKSNLAKTIAFSYVKERDNAELSAKIEELLSIVSKGKEAFAEEFAQRMMENDEYLNNGYYKGLVSSYMTKFRCAPTKENILLALKGAGRTIFTDAENQLRLLDDFYKERTNRGLDVEAVVHTTDMEFTYFCNRVDSVIGKVYFHNMIRGGIFLPTGEFVLFESFVYENGTLKAIKLSKYDSIAEMVWAYDSDGLKLDYKKVSEESIADSGLRPSQSVFLDFSLLLEQHNLKELSQNPMGAIYKLRDVLSSKVLNNESPMKLGS